MTARPRWLREATKANRRPIVAINFPEPLTLEELHDYSTRWHQLLGNRVMAIINESGATVTRIA